MDWVMIGFKLTLGYMLFGLAFTTLILVLFGIYWAYCYFSARWRE